MTDRIEWARAAVVKEVRDNNAIHTTPEDAIDRFRERLAAEGLVIVPREPTEEMERAGTQPKDSWWEDECPATVYDRMIAAALKEQG